MSVTLPLTRDDSSRMDACSELFVRYRERGDLAALGQVFDALAPQLLALALHLCGHAADAEDALQATFVVAMQKASSFDPSRPVGPWLAGILAGEAKNLARTALRRRSEALPELVSGDAGPATEVERRELVAQLRTQVEALPTEQRQAVLLQLQHGLQPAEIAEVLAVPPGTVRMRLHRGLRALRKLLPAGLAAWVAGLLPTRGLAAVKLAVLQQAGLTTAGAVTTTVAIGGALVMKKALLGVVLVLLASMLVVLPPWGSPSATPTPEAPPAAAPIVADGQATPRGRSEVATASVSPEPPASLRLRAVEDDGRVVQGFPLRVTLVLRTPDGGERPTSLPLPLTDAAGLAPLPPWRAFVPARHELLRATVSAPMLGDDGPTTPIDLDPPRNEPIDVHVPAFGQLDIELLDADGAPWRMQAGSEVRVHGTSQPDWNPDLHSYVIGPDGHARIRRVRCGAPLEVRGPWLWRKPVLVDGPVRAGDTVHLALQLPGDAVVVTGRLLDGEHHPYARRVTADVVTANGSSSGQAVSIAADGRFGLVLLPSYLGPFTLRCVGWASDQKPAGEEAEVFPFTPLLAGRNDVGDVVMAKAPLLVAGRVLAADDKPAQGVQLILERRGPDTHGAWLYASDLRVIPDADGTFAVHALPRTYRYRLLLRAPGRPQVREFEPGTEALTLRVAKGGSVTATVFPAGKVEQLEIKLVSLTPTDPFSPGAAIDRVGRERGHLTTPDERVRVDWDGLDPGPYRFVLALPGFGPLLQFELAVADGPVQDPRLVDIDLRHLLQTLRVQVTDAAGQRLPVPAQLLLHGGTTADAWAAQQITPDTSSIATFTVGQAADLYVVAKGYRGVLLPSVAGDVQVALLPAPHFTLSCAQLADLPAGITAHLTWMLTEPLDAATAAAQMRRNHRRTVGSVEQALLGRELPQSFTAGRAEGCDSAVAPVTFELVLRRGQSTTRPLPVQPSSLDGTQLADGQTIEVAVDAAALAKAIAEVQRR